MLFLDVITPLYLSFENESLPPSSDTLGYLQPGETSGRIHGQHNTAEGTLLTKQPETS